MYYIVYTWFVVGWSTEQRGFGEAPSVKTQLLHLVRSIRTVMRSKFWSTFCADADYWYLCQL